MNLRSKLNGTLYAAFERHADTLFRIDMAINRLLRVFGCEHWYCMKCKRRLRKIYVSAEYTKYKLWRVWECPNCRNIWRFVRC